MSYGMVICSACKREVHQAGDKSWFHCDDKTARCQTAVSIFPNDASEIIGKYCGSDEMKPFCLPDKKRRD